MAASTFVTVQPPSGVQPPWPLMCGPTTYYPNTSGQYSVLSTDAPALIANGWSYVVASGTTHVP